MNTYRIPDSLKKLYGSTKHHWRRLAHDPSKLDGHADTPERAQTDQGLRIERSRADEALAEKQVSVEGEADRIVHRAREHADAVVVAARDKADEALDPGTTPVEQQAAVAEQRTVEDEALREERATADETIRQERNAAAVVLAKLLPIERDATDRYLLTERSRSDGAIANRDSFLGIVAHDLRDLLGGVVLSAELLSRIAAGSEKREEILAETGRLQRYAARMKRLIADLVDTASIDAGKLAMTSVRGDVALLLAEAVDAFRAAATAKGVSLELEAIGGPLTAAFDHDRMLQVLANAISNAIKFTPAGGRIAIRGERAGNELRFAVTDTGPGIPAEALETVFERFSQVGRNDRRGLGLGLYLSRCIVEAHGGRIWAESAPGEGTRILFTLPA